MSDAQGLRTLEGENAKLKRLLTETMLNNSALKDFAIKTSDARCEVKAALCPFIAKGRPMASHATTTRSASEYGVEAGAGDRAWRR